MKLIDNGRLYLDLSPALADGGVFEGGKAHHKRICKGSSGVDTLSRTMQSLEEDRKNQVRLSKRHRVKFRRNSLWDEKQKNGKVICIKPENYQKPG